MNGMVVFVGAVVIIGVAVVLVGLFLKKANARYTQLWAPLVSVVGGSAKGSKLTGTFNGTPVEARINAVSDDNSTDYFFELALTLGAQGKDWSLDYTGDKLLGMGAKSWHVKTKDEALKRRLADAGALAAIEQWAGYPAVTYKAKSGVLKYSARVDGMYSIPAADEFKTQLELLRRLAQINQQSNGTAPAMVADTAQT